MKKAELPKGNAVRFTQLVEDSGRPEVMTVWANPKKDRSFMQLVEKQRVATLVQKPTGTKKDFGFIGFYPQPFSAFIVFPKALKPSPGTQIIGIKYDLLATASPAAAKGFEPTIVPRQKAVPKPPVEWTFAVRVRRNLSQDLDVEVRSKTVRDGKIKALAIAAAEPLPARTKMTGVKIVTIKKVAD